MANRLDWQITPVAQNDRENEQIGDEFFSDSDAMVEVSSLVRESIQNSIDARKNPAKPITMRFTVGEQSGANNKKYFSNLEEHVKNALAGENLPSVTKKSNFLVIEDFNTTGLEGSVKPQKQGDVVSQKYGDSFWYFEWASGQTNKAKGKRGSWGVGKIVFASASQFKTYLVYSVREKTRSPEAEMNEILFGHSILKYASLGKKRIKPDRPWMIKAKNGDFVPEHNVEVINKFKSDWKVSRRNGQFGTSIIVPFSRDTLTIDRLKQCIIQDYFIAVLDGILEVQLEGIDGKVLNVDAHNIIQHIENLEDDNLISLTKSKEELVALCKMYNSHLAGEAITYEIPNEESFSNRWENLELSEEQISEIASELDAGAVFSFKCEIKVPASKNGDGFSTEHFTVLMARDERFSKSRTVFSRQGILIPKANVESHANSIISIVLIENNVSSRLAQFLTDAEGPAHKEWTVTERIKKRYEPQRDSRAAIIYVKYSFLSVVNALNRSLEVNDDRTLSKYFPLSNDNSTRGKITPTEGRTGEGKSDGNAKGGGGGKGKRSHGTSQLRIDPIDGGYSIQSADQEIDLVDCRFKVLTAYSLRSGDSIASWSAEDFELSNLLNSSNLKGVEYEIHDNMLIFKVRSNDFHLEFLGFDPLRDISVLDTKLSNL